jgi:hypothetical protein
MAGPLEVGLVEKESFISAMLGDVKLCGNDVIDICAGPAAVAELCDLAKRIAR